MDVGARELKQRLSEYLDRAARGEQITVTDRGRPKALLGPIPGGDNTRRGLEEGWITPPASHAPLPAAPHRAQARMTVEEMLAEDRGE
jgi:prevent-host-death family protein